MQKIKNIIFDYGNVIFMIDFPKLKQAFVNLGIRGADTFFSHTAQSSLFDALDRGEVNVSQFREAVRAAAGNPMLTDEEIDRAWNSLLIGVPDGYHALLQELKQQYRTFLLSNNNEIHYGWIMDYLQREHDLTDNSRFFEKDYYSHLLGMRKPDAEIFHFVLDTHGLEPEQTLFIDDSPQHVAAAKQLGIEAQLILPGDPLPDLLDRLGIWKK